jgi:hypothetical protein
MLQNVAAEIVTCYERARLAREKSERAINKECKAEFLAAEDHWLGLALSYERAVVASLLGSDHERQDCYCVFDGIGRSHCRRHFVHRFCTYSGRPGEGFHGGCGRETDRGYGSVHRAFRCVEGPRLHAGRL